jgi:hypothetical protein
VQQRIYHFWYQVASGYLLEGLAITSIPPTGRAVPHSKSLGELVNFRENFQGGYRIFFYPSLKKSRGLKHLYV